MGLNRKNYEIVADELMQMIVSGVIKPGNKLEPIETLARQYRVGRSTVREALSLLKARGMIQSVQGDGTYVADNQAHSLGLAQNAVLASATELLQLLQVRKIVEVGCISLATQFRTQANVDELDRVVQHMKHSVGNEEVSQGYDLNFHLAIARATQNPLLQQMMEGISATMMRTIRDTRKLWLYSERESAARLFEEHRLMYQAIVDHDHQTATDTMARHLDKVAAVLRSPERGQEQT